MQLTDSVRDLPDHHTATVDVNGLAPVRPQLERAHDAVVPKEWTASACADDLQLAIHPSCEEATDILLHTVVPDRRPVIASGDDVRGRDADDVDTLIATPNRAKIGPRTACPNDNVHGAVDEARAGNHTGVAHDMRRTLHV